MNNTFVVMASKTATNKKFNIVFFWFFGFFKKNISKKIIKIKNNKICPDRSVPCSDILIYPTKSYTLISMYINFEQL